MRDHLATLIDDFRRFDRETAVVHYRGNRRHVSTYGDLARLAGRFAAFLAEQGIVQVDHSGSHARPDAFLFLYPIYFSSCAGTAKALRISFAWP